MMWRMRVLLAGNPGGSSAHASHAGSTGARPRPGWPRHEG